MRILIIDDDSGSAESLRDNLELEQYEVDVAPNAATARRLCQEGVFSVVLLDLGLPDCTPLETATSLLPDIQKLCPDANILVLTGNTSLDVAVQAFDQGASSYLLKPVYIPRLLDLVRQVTEKQRQQQQIIFQSTMLESVQEAVIALNLDGSIRYWNRGARLLFGWTAEEMRGHRIDRLLPDGDHFALDVPEDGSPRPPVETVRKCKDNTLVEVEERRQAIRDTESNSIIGYMVLARDITERRRIARREHQIAVTFQQALLPEIPDQRPGLLLAWRYSPAWKEADVGGDFYDVLPLPDDRTALILGDVSGKGLSAGVLMSRIRHVLHAYADIDPRPEEVLTKTNRHLAPIIPEERFVTLFYATYNPAEQCMAYSSAGHEPAILRRADGAIELLEASGPMVGLDLGIEFECVETPFQSGDLLLLYTDGASEAGIPDSFLGTDGLARFLQELAHLPVEEIVMQIHERVVERCGGFLQDDLALLCVRVV